MLNMAKASGVKSDTFIKEVDKQIAEAVIEDDNMIEQIKSEIDQGSERIGEFPTANIEQPAKENEQAPN